MRNAGRKAEMTQLSRQLDHLVELTQPAGEREKTFLNSRWRDQTLVMKQKLQGNKQGFTYLRVIGPWGPSSFRCWSDST